MKNIFFHALQIGFLTKLGYYTQVKVVLKKATKCTTSFQHCL